MGLIIFPAIDLRQGQVVRLRQGDPAAQTVYGDDPAAVAHRWADQGAEWLHVVNLDGAFRTEAEILRSLTVAQNDSGGAGLSLNLHRLTEIRAPRWTSRSSSAAASGRWTTSRGRWRRARRRVVLGTVAVRQPEVVAEAVARFGAERIVVGIDARDGMVATHGWQETSALDALTVARRMADLGVLRIVFTDIARDGTLSGVNVAATAALARGSGLKVIASGGVAVWTTSARWLYTPPMASRA